MSEHMIEYTDIQAALRGSKVVLTATAPDDEEMTVKADTDVIHEAFGVCAARFMEQYGDNTKALWTLFNAAKK